MKKWSLNTKLEKWLVIFLRTSPSYKIKDKVFIGTLFGQLFIQLWLLIYKMKSQSTSVLLLYQTV
jgi:hypothetical protein